MTPSLPMTKTRNLPLGRLQQSDGGPPLATHTGITNGLGADQQLSQCGALMHDVGGGHGICNPVRLRSHRANVRQTTSLVEAVC